VAPIAETQGKTMNTDMLENHLCKRQKLNTVFLSKEMPFRLFVRKAFPISSIKIGYLYQFEDLLDSF